MTLCHDLHFYLNDPHYSTACTHELPFVVLGKFDPHRTVLVPLMSLAWEKMTADLRLAGSGTKCEATLSYALLLSNKAALATFSICSQLELLRSQLHF